MEPTRKKSRAAPNIQKFCKQVEKQEGRNPLVLRKIRRERNEIESVGGVPYGLYSQSHYRFHVPVPIYKIRAKEKHDTELQLYK